MTIDNPVILPIMLVALLAGIGLCLYVILRFLRNMGSAKRATVREAKGEQSSASRFDGQDVDEHSGERSGGLLAGSEEARSSVDLSRVMKDAESDEIEVFRVLRVGSLGELVVEVDGRRYQKIIQIRDGTVGRRVLLAIQELEGFVGPLGQKPLPELHRLSQVPSTPSESARLNPDLAFLSRLEEPAPAGGLTEHKVDLVGYWRKGLGGALRRGSVAPATGPRSFIDEIEEMLQLRLVGRPDLAPRGIHFRGTAAGELRIEVDGRLYDRIDAIPEPAIVLLLKETIQAWDKS
jgi:hypothetical protein